MKAYQCSKCKHLQDYDTYCNCALGIDIRTNLEKGNAKLCKDNFTKLEKNKEWHQKFSWEK